MIAHKMHYSKKIAPGRDSRGRFNAGPDPSPFQGSG